MVNCCSGQESHGSPTEEEALKAEVTLTVGQCRVVLLIIIGYTYVLTSLKLRRVPNFWVVFFFFFTTASNLIKCERKSVKKRKIRIEISV